MSNAQLITSPASPAAVYRPLVYTVQARGNETLSDVDYIRPADASDVSGLGGDLVVGDILIQHDALTGDAATVGARVFIEGCGDYNGVWEVAKVIDSTHLVITSADYGTVTSPASGKIVLWPEGYTMYAEVSIYTSTTGLPTKVRLRATPDNDGIATFEVDKVLKDYFSKNISAYALPIPGGGITLDAHGVTALFYKTRFVEAWQEDPAMDPWDGDHDIDEDEDYLVAVNAVHPYCGDLLTWETAGMTIHQLGGTDYARRFLTHYPRTDIVAGSYTGPRLTLADTDHFRVFVLNRSNDSYAVDYKLMVYDMTSGSAVFVDNIDIELDDPSAAFAVGVGPADLSPHITVPAKYRVFISGPLATSLPSGLYSELLEVTVDTACKEVRRPMAALNSLGGVDLYTFTGREIETERAKRATVSKPYSPGTGFDYLESTYRNEPDTQFTLSSAPLDRERRKWVTRTFMRSANVVLKLSATQAATVILTKDQAPSSTTGPATRPVTIEYRLGVDGLAQQA